MFQFSKTMEPQSRRTAKTAEQYFAGWIAWFKSRGIKTKFNTTVKALHSGGKELKQRKEIKKNSTKKRIQNEKGRKYETILYKKPLFFF